MITSIILFLNCLFVVGHASQRDNNNIVGEISQTNVVPPEGGRIAHGRYVIPAGTLNVIITKEKGAWLTVGDNTELVIDGNIYLEGNSLRNCDIIRVTGRNVCIHGKGSIVGDRWTHKGDDGEWGMGINFFRATNATLSGLTIKDCWGDCVYVGKKSGNVLIEDCHLDRGRRQGISVTYADSVTIRNCKISNVSGTMPQYAIDIEPNMNCTVNYVLIENVEATNCEGGFRTTVPNAGVGNATIGNVEIRNCRVSANSRYPIHLNRCTTGTVEGCTIDATNDRASIYANYVEDLKICNNTLNVDVQLLASIKNKAKKLVGKNGYSTIRVVHGSANWVKNNKIIEK